MIEESKVSLDTTAILRGSLQPQRSKNLQAFRYQLRLAVYEVNWLRAITS